MRFGILSLATQNDYLKAIGLALSLRVSNPGVPTAVVCHPALRGALAPHFDHVIDEDPSLKGFVHKVHLDRYSPFQDTFYFDADILVFRDLQPIIDEWSDQPYNATGYYADGGHSAFGLDRASVAARIGRPRMVEIGGAGHAYFRKPACTELFDLARRITADYERYAGPIPYADEDAVNIALTIMSLRPREPWPFLSRHMSASPGTLKMDAAAGRCEMIVPGRGDEPIRPYIMHFAAKEAPFSYGRQLRKLYRKFGVDPAGLYRLMADDFWEVGIKWRVKGVARRLIGRKPTGPGAA